MTKRFWSLQDKQFTQSCHDNEYSSLEDRLKATEEQSHKEYTGNGWDKIEKSLAKIQQRDERNKVDAAEQLMGVPGFSGVVEDMKKRTS